MVDQRLAKRALQAAGKIGALAPGRTKLPRDARPTASSARAPGALATDVAIVCALHDPEFTAVIRAFGGDAAWTQQNVAGADHQYKRTSFTTAAGDRLRIVAGVPSYMGLTATAILATQMTILLRPKVLMMIGIAAGVARDKQNIGDILIADPSVDYASGKLTEEAGKEIFHPDSRPISIAPHLQSLFKENARRRAGLDRISDDWPAKKPSTRLSVVVGPVGASDRVVNSKAQVAQLRQHWRKAVGLEMETYALYRAAVEAPGAKPLFFSLKAVCDFAKGKTDEWQTYAAHVAASYGAMLLREQWSQIVRS